MPITTDLEKAANTLEPSVLSIKKLGRLLGTTTKSVRVGSLSSARSGLKSCLETLEELRAQLAEALQNLDKPFSSYLRSQAYFLEVSAECTNLGLQLEDNQDSWYCFPSTVVVQADEETVMINSKRITELLPSRIAAKLHAEHELARQTNTRHFLELLLKTYLLLQREPGTEIVVPVLDIFNALILWPEQKRSYSKFQFALDLYLVDRSGTNTISDKRLVFASSTGARDKSKVVSVRDENGGEKVYFGIYFVSDNSDPDSNEG